MFRDTVSGTTDLIEEAGCGGGDQEVAPAARGHAGDEVPRRVDVRHDVDIPALLPLQVGRVEVRTQPDACVGAIEVDRPERRFGVLDDPGDVGFIRDVGRHGGASCLVCRGCRPVGIAVDRDDLARTSSGKAARERASDPARGSGDDDGFA